MRQSPVHLSHDREAGKAPRPLTTPTRSLIRSSTCAVAVLALVAGLLAIPGLSGSVARAAPDAPSGADWGAGWVAGQINDNGSAPGAGDSRDVGATVQAALALAASEVGAQAFDRALNFVEANYPSYVTDDDGRDRPAALGFTILLADAADLDPRSFGTDDNASDLVARLEAIRQTTGPDAGLYGTQNPAFDGVLRQSVGLLGLAAADASPDESALTWLAGQQCPDGYFASYRGPAQRQAGTCETEAAGADSNATSLAIQAGVAHELELVAPALDWLKGFQNPDGGFGFSVEFNRTDANSTGLAVQAITAAGEDPNAGRWTQPDRDSPTTALLLLQLGCDQPAGDRGAFAFQRGDDGSLSPNALATYQAVWGLAGLAFPFDQRDVAEIAPRPPCPSLGDTGRFAGETRIGTATAIARQYAEQAEVDTVVVAHAFGYADALAGAPLAHQLGAPILLTPTEGLPDQVVDTVNDLGAGRAVVLGGTRVVSRRVADQLRNDTGVSEVDRIAGANRFATAAKIAARVGAEDVYVTEGDDPDPSRGWPDAIAAAPVAATQARPILLTTTETLPPETREALQATRTVNIVGGPNAVSRRVQSEVEDLADGVGRIFGQTRYQTALAMTRVFRAETGTTPAATLLATGEDYADALAAGPLAATGLPLMLVDSDNVNDSPATVTYTREIDETLQSIEAVGGTGAISDRVIDQIRDTAR